MDSSAETHWWRLPVINRRAWAWEDGHSMPHSGEWWQHAVIYQIFPQSFLDTTGNGIGDLKGIIQKLDYIRSLGAEAIWLTPFYPSSHEDAGYDITDFKEVDPMFGSMADFKHLLSIAHQFGLKVIIDQVWNHTSDRHPWFQESKVNRTNAKADWYVWADANADGSPPNNWLSAFTGKSAWIWHQDREQYYLANFMPSQPELNWNNDIVIETLMALSRQWLEAGVDGFRVDAVNFFVHDPALKDNPERQADDSLPDGISPDNPMARQKFTNSFCRPETLDKLSRIRQLMNEFPHTVTLGEVTLCEDSIALSGAYTAGNDRLHLAYNSALLQEAPLTTEMLHEIMVATQKHFPDGGQCWMVGNHDYQRLTSRWTGKDAAGEPYTIDFYRMAAALLIALPGALCLYQGDELGLPIANIPADIKPDEMQDPYGRCLYPTIPGRDGSRTPMPWTHSKNNAGFSQADNAWLPLPKNHYNLASDLQNLDPDSLLNTWRQLLQWRVAQPALIAGDFQLLSKHPTVFAFTRKYAEQTLYCAFNLSRQPQRFQLPSLHQNTELHTFAINQKPATIGSAAISLAPHGAIFISETRKTYES